jgi:hypothetical protein
VCAEGYRPLQDSGAPIAVGFDHPNYAHMAVLTEPVQAALAEDFD